MFKRNKVEPPKPEPKGFTEEQKRKQEALSDKLKLNRLLNENGELR